LNEHDIFSQKHFPCSNHVFNYLYTCLYIKLSVHISVMSVWLELRWRLYKYCSDLCSTIHSCSCMHMHVREQYHVSATTRNIRKNLWKVLWNTSICPQRSYKDALLLLLTQFQTLRFSKIYFRLFLDYFPDKVSNKHVNFLYIRGFLTFSSLNKNLTVVYNKTQLNPESILVYFSRR